MNNLWTLTKFNLRYYLKPRFESKKERIRYIALFAVLGVCFLPMIILLGINMYSLAKIAVQARVTDEMLSMFFLVTQIMTIVFGVTSYLQVMYFSKDNELLAAMPVSKTHIFLSKLAVVAMLEWLMSAMFVLPIGIGVAAALYSLGATLPWTFYPLLLLATVLLPMFAILVIAIAAFPIMWMISFFRKHPSFGAIFALLLAVGVIAAIYIGIYSNMDFTPETPDMPESGDQTDMIVEMAGSLFAIGRYAYPTLFLARAMLGTPASVGSIALHPAVCFVLALLIFVGLLAIGILLSVLLFRRTLQSFAESAGATFRKTNVKERVTGLTSTLIRREFKTIIRDTQLTINTFMQMFISPLMLWLFLWIFGKNSAGADAAQLSILATVKSVVFIAISTMFIGSMNTYAMTCASIEGRQMAILKTLPASGLQVWRAKLAFATIVTSITAVLCWIVVLFMRVGNVVDRILYLPTMILFGSAFNIFTTLRDLRNPKLNWISIKEITKNNFSTLIPMVISIVFAIAIAAIYFLMQALPMRDIWGSALFWIVYLAIGAGAFAGQWFVYADKIDGYFARIEV